MATKKEIMQTEAEVIARTFNRYPVVFQKGEGSLLWDNEGREYLDFFAGHAVMNLGYHHADQMKAMQQQLKQLAHTGNLYYLQSQVELAGLLVEHTFGDKVFFSNSGAEIVELAIKVARKWARRQNPQEDRYELLTVRGSFHGRTYGAISASGQDKLHRGLEPLLPGFKYVFRNDFTSAAAAITNKTCAVMLEPVQGEGGIHPSDKVYLEKLRNLCDRNQLLLIFDEIQCGLGRSGQLNAYNHYGVVPDILLLAKPLGGGLPISALVTTAAVAGVMQVGDHGSTFGGNPVAAAAGVVLMQQLAKPGFLKQVQTKAALLEEQLRGLAQKHPGLVVDIRGLGLMWGMEVKDHGPAIVQKALEAGLVINCTAGQVLRFLPSLIVSEAQIEKMIKILDKVLKHFK